MPSQQFKYREPPFQDLVRVDHVSSHPNQQPYKRISLKHTQHHSQLEDNQLRQKPCKTMHNSTQQSGLVQSIQDEYMNSSYPPNSTYFRKKTSSRETSYERGRLTQSGMDSIEDSYGNGSFLRNPRDNR